MLPDGEDIQQFYKSAVKQFASGNLSLAIELFKKLIASNPEIKKSYY